MIKTKIEINIHKNVGDNVIGAVDKGLDDIADVIFQRSQDAIVEISDTGALAESGDVIREHMRKEIVYRAVHAPFVEFGRDGSELYPPIDIIRTWCRRKLGLSGKELERATWAIATDIKKHGYEARPYLRPALEEGKRRARELLKKQIDKVME